MFDISKLKTIKGVVLETAQTEEVSANDIKRIRNDIFHMSQSSFALALGVSKKTVEAWECGRNIPSGAEKKLLYLLENNTHLMKQLYNVVDERNKIALPNTFFKKDRALAQSTQRVTPFELDETVISEKKLLLGTEEEFK